MAERLSIHLEKQQFSKLYIDFKLFFKKLDELEENNSEIGKFLEEFSINFNKIIEPERQKMAQMRGVLQTYLSKTFSEVKKTSEKTDIINEDASISFENNQEGILESKLNQDYNRTKHSLMKEKIVELIQGKIKLFQILFCDKNFGYQGSLSTILLGLYSRFPDDSIEFFGDFFDSFIEQKNFKNYLPLIDKSLDLNPKPVMFNIFSWFKILNNEKLLSHKENLERIGELFKILKIYCEIYPEYFSNHLDNILVTILHNLKIFLKNKSIINDFIFIINYFAKHGEFIIAEYSIELYNLAISIKDSKDNQRLILIALKEVFENYPEEISQKFIDENKVDYFSNEIIELISKIDDRVIIDLLIDIFIEMNMEIVRTKKTAEILVVTNENKDIIEDKLVLEDTKQIVKEILNSYFDSINKLKNKIKNHTYILFKSIAEIDSIIDENYKLLNITNFNPFQKQFLKGELMEKEKNNSEIIEILDDFIDEFKHFLNNLNL